MTGLRRDLVSWWRLAADWDALRRTDPARAEELLGDVLTNGAPVAPGDPERPRPRVLRDCGIALVRASGTLDSRDYLDAHGLDPEATDAVAHFCTWGWRTLMNPARSFDVWWYRTEHLDCSDEMNPLVHHLLFGRLRGWSPSPFTEEAHDRSPAERVVVDQGDEPRRVALFAVNDPDGIIDETIVAYVRELSRFADVHVMASAVAVDGALDQLSPFVVSASVRPHGGGTPTTLAFLAKEIGGWEKLAQYDEVVLVDDSSYLVGSLDRLFKSAASSSATVWTPQRLLAAPTWSVNEAFVPGAVFVLLRRSVVTDLRARAPMVSLARGVAQSFGAAASWAGLVHRIHAGGHRVDGGWESPEGVDELLTDRAFDRLRDGFGLLRRELLVENPYDVPNLASWKRDLSTVAPEAPVEAIAQHLARTAPDDALRRSFAITRTETGDVIAPRLMSDDEFRDADAETPTFDHWWAFPVCAYDHTFAGNERSVFEEVRDDPSIKKIILTRSRPIDVGGQNVVVVPLLSPEGQYHLLRSRQVFVKHTPLVNVPFPLSPDRHNFVNLWHGIPLKRFGYVAHDTAAKRATIVRHHVGCRAVVASSQTDSLTMRSAFHPLTLDQMWTTGLPRNDFVVREESRLPEDLRAAVERLRNEVGERRLVMFLPTFKNDQAKAYYEFSEEEISWLADWCIRENVVVGVREHMADTAHSYSRMLAPLQPVNLSSRKYPDLEVLYRVAAGLVTDYSSCVVDFLLTGRPVVSFAYDYDRYSRAERGLFYDLEKVLPGPVALDFEAFASALESLFAPRTASEVEDYAWRRRLFFDHLDDRSGERVVERVKALYVDGIIPPGSS